MKRTLVLVFLLTLSVSAQVFVPASVTLVSAFTNEKGVVVLVVKEVNGPTSYTLTCNVDQESCVIVPKGLKYSLQPGDRKVYECQNVMLWGSDPKTGTTSAAGRYCLSGED